MGELVFTFGAMGSGKSMDLLKSAYQREERGLSSVLVKPLLDARGGDQITARKSVPGRTADILLEPHMDARQAVRADMAKRAIDPSKCLVFVDEAQFITPDQVFGFKESANFDVSGVSAYGLRTDFALEVFPAAERLFALANRIEKITIPCQCGNGDAEHNTRMIDGQYVFEGEQVAIEGMGEVTYSSLCFQCYGDEKAATKKPADALLF